MGSFSEARLGRRSPFQFRLASPEPFPVRDETDADAALEPVADLPVVVDVVRTDAVGGFHSSWRQLRGTVSTPVDGLAVGEVDEVGIPCAEVARDIPPVPRVQRVDSRLASAACRFAVSRG